MNKIGRNEPCHCGSGKKYKKCCMNSDTERRSKLSSPYYMVKHANNYPIHECFIKEDWEDSGLAPILVVRKVPETGKFLFAVFLLDIYCLGLKNAYSNANVDYDSIQIIIDGQGATVSIEYEKCRELILGGIAYAKNLGFDPHKDWEQVKSFIEWEKPCNITYEFGRNGKPVYFSGPNDNVIKIRKKLEAV